MIIKINNQNTPFTIDMYQTFTGEGSDEMILEHYNENNNTELTYDDFEWEYNTKAIHSGLAKASIDWIVDNVDTKMILNVDIISTHSPRFYNYETDSYVMGIEIDDENFKKYITENGEQYNKWATDQSYNVPHMRTDSIEIDGESFVVTDDMITFYFDQVINDGLKDDYIMSMYEVSSEIWYENTTYKVVKSA